MAQKAKIAAEQLPTALQAVALISAKSAAAVGEMGVSWWHNKVAAGIAPQPVIREVRCVRWRLADVLAFWEARATAGSDPAVGERIRAQALRASGIASKLLAEQAGAA